MPCIRETRLSGEVSGKNIPDPSRSSVPRLNHSDIGNGDMMQSPSKARAAAMAGGSPGGGGDGSSSTNDAAGEDSLARLPDPLGRYAGLMAQNNLRNTVVVSPAVRNGQGLLIKPHEYRTKLATGDVVMVECQLKLWTIGPSKRDNALPEDKVGSRRYQVMLKSMKVLPDASITASAFQKSASDKKGKRKATDDCEDTLQHKKVTAGCESVDDDTDGEYGGVKVVLS
ncbi:uncharacterized protein F5891DRAFT_1195361 [Suillus fuscotomentosus]|uniref:Uncharacterized protein n=1 Tax=Suillus fuscotomentosus TaxID=1912939 RepID=A0AAD4DUV4_9AGAM|nr:uncharacterized protein F5891DRAFT_1195361 [Suillus fuscotomentosus]KAG1894380.1 hypothetical protein F5891DRAFT_1195361 [Suillus fuscotomentosus]